MTTNTATRTADPSTWPRLYWRVFIAPGVPLPRAKQPTIGPVAPMEFKSERAAHKAAGPGQRAKNMPAGLARPILD